MHLVDRIDFHNECSSELLSFQMDRDYGTRLGQIIIQRRGWYNDGMELSYHKSTLHGGKWVCLLVIDQGHSELYRHAVRRGSCSWAGLFKTKRQELALPGSRIGS